MNNPRKSSGKTQLNNVNKSRQIIYKPNGYWRYKGPQCEHGDQCERHSCWHESKIVKDGNKYYYEHDPNKIPIKN